MCGHDLRVQPQRTRRVSWVDALLVLAVIFVLLFWWQVGSKPVQDEGVASTAVAIMPPDIPVLDSTATPTVTPAPTPTQAPPPAAVTFITHTVSSGETLLSIGLQYGVTVDEIQRANGLTDVLIRIGDQLRIPREQAAETEGAAEQGAPTSAFKYLVRQGDTIISIATQLGSSVNAILQANNLTSNSIIRPGDELIVPVSAVPQEVISSAAEVTPEPTAATNATSLPSKTIYIEPQLIGPADGAVLSRTEPVLLRWVSVDLLAPNEWYVLLIYPQDGSSRQFPSMWTKATSYRLEPNFAPEIGSVASYAWQVSVVRVKGNSTVRELEAASPSSELRRFTWQ